LNAFWPFIVAGLAAGSAYAISTVGLVLTYKTTGVLNLAHGATGLVGAYVYYSLHVQLGVPTVAALVVAVVGVAPLVGLVLDFLVYRRIRLAGSAAQIVATLGLATALSGVALVLYGPATRSIPEFLPTESFKLGGIGVGVNQLVTIAFALFAAAGMWGFYRFTRIGLRTRALVDNEQLAELEGIKVSWLRGGAWMVGSAFATISALLLVPAVGLDTTALTMLVIQSFGAAAVGRLVSLPLAYVGALGLGVGASLAAKYAATIPILTGIPSSLPFLLLFAVTLASPSNRHLRARPVGARPMLFGGPQRRARKFLFGRVDPVLAAAIAALVLVPMVLNGAQIIAATGVVIFVGIFYALFALTSTSRRPSLCHAAFVSAGAIIVSHFVSLGMPFIVALICAGIAVVPVAVLVALPAVRQSDLYLALASLGFGLLVQYLIYPTSWGYGSIGVLSVGRPSLFGFSLSGDARYFWFCSAATLLVVWVLARICRGRLGLLAKAAGDTERAVRSIGVSPVGVETTFFCLAAAFAAVGGGLLAGLYGTITSGQFTFNDSLLWLAILISAGTVSRLSPWVAATLLIAMPVVLDYGTRRDGRAGPQPAVVGCSSATRRCGWTVHRRRRTPPADQ
jgi:branched-subunit amino acid ABC-type transport system permease component